MCEIKVQELWLKMWWWGGGVIREGGHICGTLWYKLDDESMECTVGFRRPRPWPVAF